MLNLEKSVAGFPKFRGIYKGNFEFLKNRL